MQMSDKGDRASEFWAEIHLRIQGKHKFHHFFFKWHTAYLANYMGGDQNEHVHMKLMAEGNQ